MIHEDIVQGMPEWFQLRLGKVTASDLWKVIPGKRGAYLKERENYMCQLAIERLTGQPTETFESVYMIDGKEREPEARAEYEIETGKLVREVGFIDHDNIKNFGASPDGLINGSGVEIKCRKPANHIQEIKSIVSGKGIDYKAYLQIQGCMMCAQCTTLDYVLYNPVAPEWMRMYYTEIELDHDMYIDLETEINKFNVDLDKYVSELEELKGKL